MSTWEDSSIRLYSASISSSYALIQTCRRGVPLAVYSSGFEGLVTMIICE